jgi:hypothetical protein
VAKSERRFSAWLLQNLRNLAAESRYQRKINRPVEGQFRTFYQEAGLAKTFRPMLPACAMEHQRAFGLPCRFTQKRNSGANPGAASADFGHFSAICCIVTIFLRTRGSFCCKPRRIQKISHEFHDPQAVNN